MHIHIHKIIIFVIMFYKYASIHKMQVRLEWTIIQLDKYKAVIVY